MIEKVKAIENGDGFEIVEFEGTFEHLIRLWNGTSQNMVWDKKDVVKAKIYVRRLRKSEEPKE